MFLYSFLYSFYIRRYIYIDNAARVGGVLYQNAMIPREAN